MDVWVVLKFCVYDGTESEVLGVFACEEDAQACAVHAKGDVRQETLIRRKDDLCLARKTDGKGDCLCYRVKGHLNRCWCSCGRTFKRPKTEAST